MCFEFIKCRNYCDVIAPVVNFTGNAAILAVGGTALGIITYAAFKALGFNQAATLLATAIPASIAAFGAAGTIAGAVCFLFVANALFYTLRRL